MELVKIGVAGEEDFELVGSLLLKGARPGAASGVIVKPAEGYSFQPAMRADITSLELRPGMAGTYMAVKQNPAPIEITATIKFSVANTFDQKVVEDTLAALKGLPGFISLDRS